MQEEPKTPQCGSRAADRKRPPGDFTSEELEEDTARFLEEVRRRAEARERRAARRKPGPPPPER
jgi:hypothetical protein